MSVESKNSSITITIGDRAENHVGMQILGSSAAHGHTLADLEAARAHFSNKETELIALHAQHDGLPAAHVLVVRNAIPDHQAMLAELLALDWDKKIFSRYHGGVVNKRARYNLCFAKTAQTPDYPNKKGTVVALDTVPLLSAAKDAMLLALGETADAVVEGNLYENVAINGIGFHGDGERKKTIGLRLGASHDLVFQWFMNENTPGGAPKIARAGEEIRITLNAGDVYVMTEKATGTDWKRRTVPTLRHAAGAAKYITSKIKKRKLEDLLGPVKAV